MSDATATATVPEVAPVTEAEKPDVAKAKRLNQRVQQDAPVESTPLSNIDNTVYPNYRRLSSNSAIEGLMTSINANGQRQNLVAGKQADGKLGLSCGFQRFEARERIAVKHVVDEYNKTFGYTPKDDKFVHLSGEVHALNPRGANDWRASTTTMMKNRRRLRETSPEWAKKYDEALANCLVNVQVKMYANAAEAALDNALENEVRDNPSMADKTEMIIGLLEGGMSPGEVAKAIDESPSTISHYKRIYNLIPLMEGWAKEATVLTGKTGEDLEAFLRKMDASKTELDRRWKLAEDDPQYLQFQKLRFLSETIDPAKEVKKLPLTVIVDLVGVLVRLNTVGNTTEEPTYDMGTLRARFKDVIELDKQMKEAAEKAAADATAAAAGVVPPTSDAIKAAAAAGAAANKPAENSTPTDAANMQNAQQAAAGVTGVVAPTDAARAAAIDAANAVTDTGVTPAAGDVPVSNLGDDDPLTPPSEAELAATAGAVATTPDDGAMRAKTGEATKARYTPLPPEKVETYALELIKDLSDPAQAEVISPYDVVSWLGGAKQLFYVMGLDKQSDAINEALIEYIDAQVAYMTKLESLLEGQTVGVQTSIKGMKPQFKGVKLPE